MAATGIGNVDPLEIDVNSISMVTGTGKIQIHDNDDLTIAGAGVVQGNDDGIEITTGLDLTVNSRVTSGGGDICLLSDRHLTLGADVGTVSDGRIALWADRDSSGDGQILQQGGTVSTERGAIFIAGQDFQQTGGKVDSQSGTISIDVVTDVRLSGLGFATLGGSLLVSGNSIQADTDLVVGDLLLLDSDTTITGTGLSTAARLGINAGGDVGSGGTPLRIDAGQLAVVTPRNAYLEESDDTGVGTVSSVGSSPALPPCAAGMPTPAEQTLDGIRTGGELSMTSGGAIAATSPVESGGNSTIRSGGGASFTSLGVGGQLDLDVGGGCTIRSANVRGTSDMTIGGTLTLDSLNSGDVLATVGGDMNGGLDVVAPRVDLTIRGTLGSESAPMKATVPYLDNIDCGGDLYLLQRVGGTTYLGSLSAGGSFDLTFSGRVVDNNGGAINLSANGDSIVHLQETLGQWGAGFGRVPVDVDIAPGTLSVRGFNLTADDNSLGWIWIVMDGRLSGSRIDQGDLPIPGLVILNNRVIAGDSALLQAIYRTQAFLIESPELKSRQGVFGVPVFLHQYMSIGQASEVQHIPNLDAKPATILFDTQVFPIFAQRTINSTRDPFTLAY